MKIDRISYKKIFPLEPYVNEQIGMEAQVEEGDVIGDVFNELKRMVESFGQPEARNKVYQIRDEIDIEYQLAKMQIMNVPYKENAEEYLKKHFPKYENVYELKSIIKQKPSKNGQEARNP